LKMLHTKKYSIKSSAGSSYVCIPLNSLNCSIQSSGRMKTTVSVTIVAVNAILHMRFRLVIEEFLDDWVVVTEEFI